VHDKPFLAHAFRPARQQLDDPCEARIDCEEEQRHHDDEGEHDRRRLHGLLARGPSHAARFRPCFLGEREELLAGRRQPAHAACGDQPASTMRMRSTIALSEK
jgi:hypothetical protein